MQIFALKRVKKKQCRIVYYAILIYYAMWFVEMNGRMAGAYPLSYDISYCLQLRPGASTKSSLFNYFPPNRQTRPFFMCIVVIQFVIFTSPVHILFIYQNFA